MYFTDIDRQSDRQTDTDTPIQVYWLRISMKIFFYFFNIVFPVSIAGFRK